MAEYQELRNKVVVESDTSGLDDVKKGIEETKDAAEGLNKAVEETGKAVESTSKATRTFQKLDDVIGSSRESLLQMIVDARKGKIEQMFGNDKFTDADFAKQGLIYLREASQLQKEIDKQSSQAKLPQEQISLERVDEIAKQTSKLDLLKMKLVDAENEYKRLFDLGIQGKRLTSALEAVMRAQTKYNEAVEEANRLAEQKPKSGLFEGQSGWDEVASAFDERYHGLLGVQTFLDSIIDKMTPTKMDAGLQNALGDAFRDIQVSATQAKSAVDGLMESIGANARSKIEKYTGGLKNIISSFKRIAFYRFIRSVIRSITDGFKEGVNNLYQWSKLLGGEFAQSMDRIATSTLYMKNSLGAMVAPLINALAPAVDYLIDKFVALLNVINQVLALFSGATTWTKAKKYPTQYANAVASGAGKAADALHKLGLAQIDELTILDKNHGDNGSGGGGGSGLDYGSMFETEKLGGGIWDKIKEAIDNGDWRGAGKILAERLNEIVAGLDTHKWGQEIGTKINNGLEFAYGFLKFTDFKQIGSKIADFINGGFEAINFNTAGRLVARKITALWDTIIGFVTRLDWGLVARSIGNYFIGLFSEFSEWMESIDWFDLGQQIQQKIYDAISNVNWVGLADSIVRFFTDNVEAVLKFGIGLVFPLNEPKFEDKSHWGWKEWAEHIIGEIAPPASALIGFTIGGVPGALVGLVVGLGLKFTLKTDLVGKAEKYGERLNEVVKHQSQRAQTTMDQSGSKMEESTGRHFNNMQTKISTSLGGTSGIVNSKTGDIGRQISSSWNNSERNTDTSWSGIVRKIGDWIEKAKQKLNFSWKLPEVRLPHIPTPHFSMATGIMGIQYPKFDGWWAEGGFPQQGSLFIANEAGAEMVGSIGGHTAVANNDQIVEAVSQGVYEAVRDAMGNGKQSVNVYLDGKQISGAVVQNINSETRRTGNSPLLSY